ncbi:MAG: hypothetical protein IJU23_06730 [Proteobacteria bacterium]|nr:hypothetical protein [Pseudomonadota bacterium]
MKNLWIYASVLAAVCTMVGCADDNDASQNVNGTCTVSSCKDASTLTLCNSGISQDITCPYGCENAACKTSATPSTGGNCTVNVCKDATTLAMCFQGTAIDYPCPNGCENGQCKSAIACTTNQCKDATTLQVCNNGQYVETACPFGCSNGACMASQGTSQCSINVCKDADVLLACSNGVQVPTVCPYGCEAGNCKSACTGNVCKDSNVLLVCQGGKTIEMPCQLGCDAGQCKAACTSDFCMTSQILMHCGNSVYTPVDCPFGCEAGACKTSISTGCTNGSRQCDSNGNVQVCENGIWQTQACSNGCVNGACVNSTGCTNGSKQCDSNGNALICVNGSWQTQNCAFGCNNGACLVCENGTTQCKSDGKTVQTCSNGAWYDLTTCDVACSGGACTTSTTCTNGAKQCNGVYVQTCTNGQWVNASSACENGCENGACKSAPSTCTNGAKQCSGAYVQTCTNGQWVSAASACPNGCENGACKGSSSSTLPTVGETCDLNEFENVCDNNSLYYCSSSAVKNSACSDGSVCKVSADDPTNGDCTELCSASEDGSVEYYYCYDLGTVVYSIPIVCGATTDGDYAYFMDFDTAQACTGSCSETKGCGGGSSTGNYEVCDNTCYVDKETTCKQYCTSAGSNVCYMDDENVYCYDPNGSEPGTGSCDYFDCTSMYSSSDCSLGTVICDAESAYCVERDSSYDNQCTNGGKAYFTEDGKGYCLNVGSDESCLSGGGSTEPGTESDIYLGASCTSAQLNQKVDVCAYDSYYSGYFTDYLVCMNHETYGMIWFTYTGTYDECKNKCNTAGTACDSSGSTSYEYELD